MLESIKIKFNSGNVYTIEPLGTKFILMQESMIIGKFDSVNKAIDRAMQLK